LFIQFGNRVFQLIFIRTELELSFELVVLLVGILRLLLLSGEALLEAADVVLFGEELALEGGDFFVRVLMLWLLCLFVLHFLSMFGVFLFSRSRFVGFCSWFGWHSFGSGCDRMLFFGFDGFGLSFFGLGWLLLLLVSSWFGVLLGLSWWVRLVATLWCLSDFLVFNLLSFSDSFFRFGSWGFRPVDLRCCWFR